MRPAHGLQIGVSDKAALAVTAACGGAAIRLLIVVTDETALAGRATVRTGCAVSSRPALSLHIPVAYETALALAAAGMRPAHGLQIGVSDKAALAVTAAVDRPAIRLLVQVAYEAAIALPGLCKTWQQHQ